MPHQHRRWGDRPIPYAGALVKPDGTNLRRLTTTGHIIDAVFSPDGKRIAYSRKLTDGNAYLFVRNTAGGGEVKIGPGRNPSWSPDATRLAFVGRGGIAITPVRAGATGRVLLSNKTAEDDDPRCAEERIYNDVDWAPRGGRIAASYDCYNGHANTDTDIVRVSDAAVLLTVQHGQMPEFDPTGNYLPIASWTSLAPSGGTWPGWTSAREQLLTSRRAKTGTTSPRTHLVAGRHQIRRPQWRRSHRAPAPGGRPGLGHRRPDPHDHDRLRHSRHRPPRLARSLVIPLPPGATTRSPQGEPEVGIPGLAQRVRRQRGRGR